MKRSAIFFAALLVMPLAGLWAEDGEGLSTGLILLKSINARVIGLGQGFAAVNGGADSIGINPAGAATLKNGTLSATYMNGIVDDNFGSALYAHPIAAGSLFAGVSYFDAGTIEITPTGGPTETKRAQQDQVGLIGLALGKESPFSLGLSAKFYRFELAQTASASGVAADAGVLWRTPAKGFSLGGSLQNLGSDLQYEVAKEPLPQTMRVGAAYDCDFQKFSALRRIPYDALLTADAVKTKNQKSGIATGLEFRTDLEISDLHGAAALRGGFNSVSDTFSFGVGFIIANLTLDYAMDLMPDNLGELHRVTLAWRFGEKEPTSFSKKNETLRF